MQVICTLNSPSDAPSNQQHLGPRPSRFGLLTEPDLSGNLEDFKYLLNPVGLETSITSQKINKLTPVGKKLGHPITENKPSPSLEKALT